MNWVAKNKHKNQAKKWEFLGNVAVKSRQGWNRFTHAQNWDGTLQWVQAARWRCLRGIGRIFSAEVKLTVNVFRTNVLELFRAAR